MSLACRGGRGLLTQLDHALQRHRLEEALHRVRVARGADEERGQRGGVRRGGRRVVGGTRHVTCTAAPGIYTGLYTRRRRAAAAVVTSGAVRHVATSHRERRLFQFCLGDTPRHHDAVVE